MRTSDYTDKKCSLCGDAMVPNVWHDDREGRKILGEFYPSGIVSATIVLKKRSPTWLGGLIKRHEKHETLDLCMSCGRSLNEWTASRHPVTCLCSSASCPGKMAREAKRKAAREASRAG